MKEKSLDSISYVIEIVITVTAIPVRTDLAEESQLSFRNVAYSKYDMAWKWVQ